MGQVLLLQQSHGLLLHPLFFRAVEAEGGGKYVLLGPHMLGDEHVFKHGQGGKQADVLEGPGDAQVGDPVPIAGGQAVVFEAKYTTTDRLRREVLTKEQMDALDRHWKMGASAAVCAGIQDQYFFVPWKVWDGMKERFGRKYVTARDLEPYRVKFNGAVMFLDYIHQKGDSGRR